MLITWDNKWLERLWGGVIYKVRRPSKVMQYVSNHRMALTKFFFFYSVNLLKRFKGVSILLSLKFKVSFAIKKTIYNVFNDCLYFIFFLLKQLIQATFGHRHSIPAYTFFFLMVFSTTIRKKNPQKILSLVRTNGCIIFFGVNLFDHHMGSKVKTQRMSAHVLARAKNLHNVRW